MALDFWSLCSGLVATCCRIYGQSTLSQRILQYIFSLSRQACEATIRPCWRQHYGWGGHLSLRLGSLPFDLINLAGSGYTIRQIQGQVHKALAYNPNAFVITAGTYDLFGD